MIQDDSDFFTEGSAVKKLSVYNNQYSKIPYSYNNRT